MGRLQRDPAPSSRVTITLNIPSQCISNTHPFSHHQDKATPMQINELEDPLDPVSVVQGHVHTRLRVPAGCFFLGARIHRLFVEARYRTYDQCLYGARLFRRTRAYLVPLDLDHGVAIADSPDAVLARAHCAVLPI